jgi:Helix-turn-helix domain
MVTNERRQAIDHLLQAWDAGQEQEAKTALLEIVKMLWGMDKPLLTTTEAAELLGMRSVNTLKVLLRTERVPTVKHGNRTMIPLSELLRLRSSRRLRDLRAVDRLHDESANLGADEGMSDKELEALSAGRPGTLPWQRKP